MYWLLAALSGLLLFLIHPGFSLTLLAPVALAPLLVAMEEFDQAKQRFLAGWLCGFVQWFGLCYWISATLDSYGGLTGPAAWAVYVLFALAKGLNTAVYALVGGWVAGRQYSVLLLALLWVGMERLHAPLGFTWLQLGNAGTEMGLPMRLAPLVGVWGLSFCFALMSAVLATVWMTRDRRQMIWLAPLTLLWVLPALPPMERGKQEAVLLQPNLQAEESSPERTAALHNRMINLSAAAALTTEPVPPRMILWPEAPAELYYESDPLLRDKVNQLARVTGIPLLFNGVALQKDGTARNAVWFVNGAGDRKGRYDQIHLVPFGEYIPPGFGFIEQITMEAGTFTPGEFRQAFPLWGRMAGVFICYESAFANHVAAVTRLGSNVLVNPANDGYFGTTWARQQHLQLVRMRAAENRRWVLRPTNNGESAVVDSAGRVMDQLTPYREEARRVRFNWETEATLYTRHGDWFAWLALLAPCAFALWLRVPGLR
jgi:apolipoprotein N-acyltransferase